MFAEVANLVSLWFTDVFWKTYYFQNYDWCVSAI